MSIYKFYLLFKHQLKKIYSQSELDPIFFILVSHIMKWDKTTIFSKLIQNEKISFFLFQKLEKKLWELKQNRPIQYVIGKTHFLGMDFIVNENVFIPRPETEELVSWILENPVLNQKKKVQLFDLCTGCGCIGITLKKKKPFIQRVYLIDCSEKALQVAKKNAKLHKTKIFFIKLNILKNLNTLSQSIPHFNSSLLNIIVSNPPYIPISDHSSLHLNITQYEPFKSLFVPNQNPLIFYQKISIWIKKNFIGMVYVYFEINQFFNIKIIDLMKRMGFYNIKIRKDFQGFFRMIRAEITINKEKK